MATTILAPLDGSPLAERAVPYAAALARAASGRLIVLHAWAELASVGSRDCEMDAVIRLDKVVNWLREAGIAASLDVSCGDAAPAILEAADEVGADVIVMSSHGRVADRVLHQAGVPVLLVPTTCDRAWPDDRALRVLVPLDGSQLAEEVLGPTGDFANAVGAELLLLRVVESLDDPYGEGFWYTALEPGSNGDVATSARPEPGPVRELAESRRYLETTWRKLQRIGTVVETQIGAGDPAQAIANVAREQGVDVVAMVSHRPGGLAYRTLGDVATRTLQRVSVPLLLVPPAAVRRRMALAERGGRVVAII